MFKVVRAQEWCDLVCYGVENVPLSELAEARYSADGPGCC
jgi:hypothetical protein